MNTLPRSISCFAGACLWAAAAAVGAAPLPAPQVDATALVNSTDWIDPLAESRRWSSMPELSEDLLPLQATVLRAQAARPAHRTGPAVESLGWTATAPDPGLYALVGLGLLSLALLARRRRH